MKIYLGCDHRGLELKNYLADFLRRSDYEVVDEGAKQLNPEDDNPVFAARVVNAMKASDEDDPKGMLICGSGQGISIAANRFKGIRAALCWNVNSARASRNDDNSNVLCLPAEFVTPKDAELIVNTWLSTPFAAAPRYIRRLKETDELT